jgi:hypothetical protein
VNDHIQASESSTSEVFLSGAYDRIRRITILLALAAVIIGTFWLGWRNGLVLMVGSAIGYLNFIWLHRATSLMTDRMMPGGRKPPSKSRLLLAFGGRYIFMILMAYVILRGYPRMILAFTATLVFPIIAAVCEGVYELFAKRSEGEAPHQGIG